jgi:hypothetical protein
MKPSPGVNCTVIDLLFSMNEHDRLISRPPHDEAFFTQGEFITTRIPIREPLAPVGSFQKKQGYGFTKLR